MTNKYLLLQSFLLTMIVLVSNLLSFIHFECYLFHMLSVPLFVKIQVILQINWIYTDENKESKSHFIHPCFIPSSELISSTSFE